MKFWTEVRRSAGGERQLRSPGVPVTALRIGTDRPRTTGSRPTFESGQVPDAQNAADAVAGPSHFSLIPRRVARDRFTAWLPDDVMRLKLNGFIASCHAKVVKVSRDGIQLRIGKRQLLGSWSKFGEQPLIMMVKFDRDEYAATSDVQVRVELTSGSRDNRVNGSRATRLLRELRFWLMSQELHGASTRLVVCSHD